ncbi:MAG: hypothetical protein Q7V63_08300 [Gammaproteobacteria bacterium]|nr:hypothetical protein [Gammaproteobacteria bacterium]
MQQLIGLLGFIAILQLGFIPGYIIMRAFRLKLPILRSMLVSFFLSFLANYIVVFSLTLLHGYTPTVVWGLIAIEALVLLWLFWPSHSGWDAWQQQASLCQGFWQSLNRGASVDRFIRLGLFFAAMFILLIFLGIFINQLGQVFNAWDPVMSYNVWALEWAAGHIPQDTWHYPQLIPANWSLTYVITAPASSGLSLQFFAKALMPLFPLMLLLALLDLAIETRRTGYLLGIIFTAFLLSRFAESFGQGWVDVPMASFALLSMTLLFLAGTSDKPYRYIALSSLMCAGSAVTKQAGLYIVLWYPVLCYILALRPHANRGFAKHLSPLIFSWAFILIISLPWYLYIQYQIDHGLASSEIGFVTQNIFQVLGYGWGLRISFGVFQAGLVFWLLLAVACVYMRSQSSWRILIALIVPYTIIWIAFYSYATRNFVLVAPMLGLIAGLSCEELYANGSIKKWLNRVVSYFTMHAYKPLHLIMALMIIVVIITEIPQCSTPALNYAQLTQQKKLGDAALNSMLLRYQVAHGFKGKIMTSWDYIGHVPGIAPYYQPYRPAGVEANSYQSAWMLYPQDLALLLKKYPASYILVANQGGLVSLAYLQYFKRLEQEKLLKPIVVLPHFTLYEIVGPIS